jgi:hypothetical protein
VATSAGDRPGSATAAGQGAEVKLQAERKAGEMLAQLEKTDVLKTGGPGRPPQNGGNIAAVLPPSEYREALDETQTDDRLARRWQTIAELPEEVFEQHLAEQKAAETIKSQGKPAYIYGFFDYDPSGQNRRQRPRSPTSPVNDPAGSCGACEGLHMPTLTRPSQVNDPAASCGACEG